MQKIRIHQDWQFWKDGQKAGKRTVQLPHDAMLLEERIPDMENGSGAAFYPGTRGWLGFPITGGMRSTAHRTSLILWRWCTRLAMVDAGYAGRLGFEAALQIISSNLEHFFIDAAKTLMARLDAIGADYVHYYSLLGAGVRWIAPGSPDDSMVLPIVEAMENGSLFRETVRRDAAYLIRTVARHRREE